MTGLKHHQGKNKKKMDIIRKSLTDKEVLEKILSGDYIDMVKVLQNIMPQPVRVKEELNKILNICTQHPPRVIRVDKVNEYEIYISIPGGKKECDFIVWRYSLNLHPPLKIPTHDDLAKKYVELKRSHELIEDHLINSVLRLIRDRWKVEDIIKHYFETLDVNLKNELKKFLVTLKWIALQEDINYPPPKYLGSKFTLAVYILLEGNFTHEDLRKLLRFK